MDRWFCYDSHHSSSIPITPYSTLSFGYQEELTNVSQTNDTEKNNISSINAKGKNAISLNDVEFTDLDQIDPMLDNIKIKARCISVWHSHPAGKPNQAYSFDVVLQDMKSTKVTRIDHFDEDVFGFKLEPFSDILSKKYNEKDSVDVVGAIVAIGDIIPIPNSLGKKVKRTVIIEDTEGTRVKCTFWDKWAKMFNQYVTNDAIGPVTFVLQLAKVKYFKDEPAVQNSLFGSRIFINKDIPAITSFKQRHTAKKGYTDGDHKIEVFTPPIVKITPEIFFKQTVKSTVGGVRDLQSALNLLYSGKCIAFTKNTVGVMMPVNGATKWPGNRKAYTCDDHGVIYQVVPRFKVILRIIDEIGSTPFVVFDTNMSRICNGVSAYEIMNKHGQNTADYFPNELNEIVGNKYLFKFTYTQHNVNSNSQVYTAKSVTDDAELIGHFNAGFADGQDGDDQYKTPDVSSAHTGVFDAASLNINKFLLETPDNQAQSSTNRSVASSANIDKLLLETPDNQFNQLQPIVVERTMVL